MKQSDGEDGIDFTRLEFLLEQESDPNPFPCQVYSLNKYLLTSMRSKDGSEE